MSVNSIAATSFNHGLHTMQIDLWIDSSCGGSCGMLGLCNMLFYGCEMETVLHTQFRERAQIHSCHSLGISIIFPLGKSNTSLTCQGLFSLTKNLQLVKDIFNLSRDIQLVNIYLAYQQIFNSSRAQLVQSGSQIYVGSPGGQAAK